MEKQNEKGTFQVKVNPEKVETEASQSAVKEPTYEELKNEYISLWNRSARLLQENKELVELNATKRLDYLFKCLQYKDTLQNKDFISKCAEEIIESLTLTEEDKEA